MRNYRLFRFLDWLAAAIAVYYIAAAFADRDWTEAAAGFGWLCWVAIAGTRRLMLGDSQEQREPPVPP